LGESPSCCFSDYTAFNLGRFQADAAKANAMPYQALLGIFPDAD
jgi:hypothetical protein